MATLFSHYKSMGIFSGTQGQLTSQSVVRSGQISTSSEFSCISLSFFAIITLSVAMETSGLIWPNFELIQALMYVIITCKYEKDPIKNNQEKVATPVFK